MSISAIEHRRTRRPGIIDSAVPGFTLTTISNLQFWFKADSIDLDSSDPVYVWPDSSGNKNHAAQMGSTYRPTFITNVVNGHPVVRYAGADALEHPAVDYDQTSYFVVWSRTATGNNDAVLVTTNVIYSYLQYGDTWWAGNGVGLSVPMAASTFMLKACTYDNTNVRRYTNGSAETPQSSSINAQYKQLGASTGVLNGDIAEIVIYDKLLSTTERQLVENYLNEKYNLW